MIAGIGVDIAETARFEALYRRYGERFARRILTAGEYREFCRRRHPALFLATRFAAKEAAAKALGTGFDDGVGYKSIEVIREQRGRPTLGFHRAASRMIHERGISSVHLSLSDERHYAVAMVVLETG